MLDNNISRIPVMPALYDVDDRPCYVDVSVPQQDLQLVPHTVFSSAVHLLISNIILAVVKVSLQLCRNVFIRDVSYWGL
jgi:hypothetical protein